MLPVDNSTRVFAKEVHLSVESRDANGSVVRYEAPLDWGTTVIGDGYVMEGPPSQLFGPQGVDFQEDPKVLVQRELWPVQEPYWGVSVSGVTPWGGEVHFKWPNI